MQIAAQLLAAADVQLPARLLALRTWKHVGAVVFTGAAAMGLLLLTSLDLPLYDKHGTCALDTGVRRVVPGIPVAFLTLVGTNESLPGTVDLLREIYDPLDSYVVHIDIKLGTLGAQQIRTAVEGCHNVVVIADEDRLSIGRGGWTMVEAELVMIEAALAFPSWRFAMIMDAVSWPILGSQERQHWLFKHSKLLRVAGPAPRSICAPTESSYCHRTPSRCIDWDCSRVTLTPNGSPIFKGSQWVLLARDLAEHTVRSEVGKLWQTFFQTAGVPDELFFQTVAFDYMGYSPPPSPAPMYAEFGGCMSYSNDYHAGGHPCLLGFGDLAHIQGSGSMFARKIPSNETVLKVALSSGRVQLGQAAEGADT